MDDNRRVSLQEAFFDLETGICLWIGAGVTKHLATALSGDVPDWNGLTAEIEEMAYRTVPPMPPNASLSNPDRLDACMRALGAPAFHQAVSQRIYGGLCAALATFAHRHRGDLGEPPDVALQLGALGWLANPIVNFNVETLTSYLVARPAGPCRILPYRIRDRSREGVFEEQESSSDFCRTVYHPHGAVNYSGQAVMTSSEYQAHNGSLAYLLSVSAAFENNLWIVGMSLDDEYLREHLKRHRNQINCIRWFDMENQLEKHRAWSEEARVTPIPVVWPEFWDMVSRELRGQVRRAGVMTAWSHVLTAGIKELTDGDPAEQLSELAGLIPELASHAARASAESRASYRHIFQPGEGRGLLPPDFDARAIADELAAARMRAADLVNQIQAKAAEVGGDIGRDISSALENAKPRLPEMRSMNVS